MAKKRTPEELERIRQRKEFVQSKPDLDPAKARQQFYVQTRVKELEKSGAEVTKERRAALRQKFASGDVQRAGFYTPTDVAKFTGNNNNNTTPTPAPTVRQTGGYVSPSMRKPVPGFKPGTVQTSSKSKGTGFKQLGKDIVSGAASAKRNIDLFIDEATGSAAIQRAMDNKSAPLKNRIGEGLLGVVTGIANVSGVGYLSTSVRGARAASKASKFVSVVQTKTLTGKKPPLQLPRGQRVVDRVFDMPAAPVAKKAPVPKKAPVAKKAPTKSPSVTSAQRKAKADAMPSVTPAQRRAKADVMVENSKQTNLQTQADKQIELGLKNAKVVENIKTEVAKKAPAKKAPAKKPTFKKADAQAAPYQDVPAPGSTLNIGQQGVGGNPVFRSRDLGIEGKTITSSGSAGRPAVKPAAKPVAKPVAKPAAKPALSTKPTGQTFRNTFETQDQFNTWFNTGGKGQLDKLSGTLRQDFITKNQKFIRANNQRSAGRTAADLARERRRAGAVERLNKMRGVAPKAKTPASQDPLKQPKPISEAAKKAAVKKAPAKKAPAKKAPAKKAAPKKNNNRQPTALANLLGGRRF